MVQLKTCVGGDIVARPDLDHAAKGNKLFRGAAGVFTCTGNTKIVALFVALFVAGIVAAGTKPLRTAPICTIRAVRIAALRPTIARSICDADDAMVTHIVDTETNSARTKRVAVIKTMTFSDMAKSLALGLSVHYMFLIVNSFFLAIDFSYYYGARPMALLPAQAHSMRWRMRYGYHMY
jgi:hypothetical protein